jgi:acyl-homoserine lactone acylase PvdQ
VRQIMPQNVMIADTGGNIYYQRTGRVPKRPYGFDWSAPVDGSTSRTEWQGIHDVADLMSILNPKSGYMQNNNIGPDTMMVESPLQAGDWPSYLYNQPARYTHQRGAVAVALLEGKEKWSEEDLKELALDTSVYQAERWIAELQLADQQLGGEAGKDAASGKRGRAAQDATAAAVDGYRVALAELTGWNRRADAASPGALVYYFWRRALREHLSAPRRGERGEAATAAGAARVAALERKVDDWLAPFGRSLGARSWQAGALSRDEQQAMVVALERAGVALRERFGMVDGRLDASFGDVFRVGRLDGADDRSWPVGGGSLRDEGMATLRAISFEPERADGKRWGRSGQTSTQVVVLTNPIRSWTQPPIGQSDRVDSPHYRDQAEKLFSAATLKESWFGDGELTPERIESELELEW